MRGNEAKLHRKPEAHQFAHYFLAKEVGSAASNASGKEKPPTVTIPVWEI